MYMAFAIAHAVTDGGLLVCVSEGYLTECCPPGHKQLA